jgi:hypothetical protein
MPLIAVSAWRLVQMSAVDLCGTRFEGLWQIVAVTCKEQNKRQDEYTEVAISKCKRWEQQYLLLSMVEGRLSTRDASRVCSGFEVRILALFPGFFGKLLHNPKRR